MKVWTGDPDKILKEFYVTVCMKDGEDYESKKFSSNNLLLSFEKEYKHWIILERGFENLKQVLEGKAQKLLQQGKANSSVNWWAKTKN